MKKPTFRSAGIARAFALACALLAGCAMPSGPTVDAEPADMPTAVFEVRRGTAGGVVVPEQAWSLTSDVRAFRAGDVLTVELQEATQASKKSGTQFGKNSSTSLQKPSLMGSVLPLDAELGAKRKFDGSGSSSQQNTLRGSVTVIVQRVMPNGLLQVRGEKRLTLNLGEEIVRLAGYVRAADIDASNRVSSQRVADARISYAGRGSLADANRPGWLTRFFNSPWMPF
ncbi:flagellar basal body L-ring protein [Burkholderia ubonensis]|uniref:flagellar basal body L-ring protein FlgH n=1 Tax=Burkholderia ubonensis TaxID=101571 RepID=UPI00075D0338|nr:flagellar basal body L-ring protein FlgH [Burkholderia ubonensis]KVO87671.1 flagellar basal body L-ring protein [Burkholderia ubonensis]KVZ57288.1 flagellar basal body L-ring protein [Burkholderia ubonensis]KVZ72985.1 flagellar basal body L-ring protein [Burkholderia ubonensis]